MTDLSRRIATFVVAVAVALGAALVTTPAANAAAYPIGVYAPKKIAGPKLEGWANLSRDCGGTLGCFNYIKIEKNNWYGPSFVAGWWANNNGWNSISTALPSGCADYRTTTDSYNDVAGSYGGGVNIGPVGVTANGTKIYRYKTTWSSGWARICR